MVNSGEPPMFRLATTQRAMVATVPRKIWRATDLQPLGMYRRCDRFETVGVSAFAEAKFS
jgi:hypothetical protein